MTLRLRQVLAALVALQAPLWAAGTALLLRDDVPDPLPTHWNLSGDVDGTSGLTAFTAVVLTVVAAAAVVALGCVVRARRTTHAGLAAAVATWAAGLPAALYVATLAGAAGAGHAGQVRLPLAGVALATLVPFLAAFLVLRLLPTQRPAELPITPPASSLTLADGEHVVWVGQASSRPLLAGGVVLALGAVPLWFVVWPAALVAGAWALVLAWVHVVTVRVDDAGVAVSWGPARWPRVRVALDEIAGAEADRIEPLRWGGWGYRLTTRGRAAVARRGPGIVLTLRDGRRFAATVDRPEAAVDLVNALVARLSRTAR
jgi:hypothetical protein